MICLTIIDSRRFGDESLLAGAFGNLGRDVLAALVREGHDVLAAGPEILAVPGINGTYRTRLIDATEPDTLYDIFEGFDCVISTVGLTTASRTVTNYDVDYLGNMNLLREAKRAGVRKFAYVSVIKADSDATVPILDAKNKFEQELKASGIPYVIYRPTGYFYDIAKVFKPMIEKGKVTLLGKKDYFACA